MAEKRLGCQQPTQSLVLPYKKTCGSEAIELYKQTGRDAYEWQSLLVSHILAENKDGLFVHAKFGYAVPRRNGKNEVVAIREMIGLKKHEKILHTAHRTTTSHAAWERLCILLDKAKIGYSSLKAAGRESINLDSGGRIDFRTRSSKGGLGEGFDLLVIDEAQEYTDDQESALKYVVTDSENPQTIFCGTPPTFVSSGTVFTKLRATVLDGTSEDTGWAEWSVEKESDTREKDLWYLTNPSLGFKLTERAISAEITSDVIDFNIQRLGLWVKYNQKSAISEKEWLALAAKGKIEFKGKLYVGVKYGHDGTNVAVSIAIKTKDGKIFVEAIDCRNKRSGADWIVAFIKDSDVAKVVIDGASGQQLLATALKDIKAKKPILPTVKEIIVANATFEQGVFGESVQHKNQPSLTRVVSNCDKRLIGTNGGFGYKAIEEEAEIALLDSIILAHWACVNGKETKKQRASY